MQLQLLETARHFSYCSDLGKKKSVVYFCGTKDGYFRLKYNKDSHYSWLQAPNIAELSNLISVYYLYN